MGCLRAIEIGAREAAQGKRLLFWDVAKRGTRRVSAATLSNYWRAHPYGRTEYDTQNQKEMQTFHTFLHGASLRDSLVEVAYSFWTGACWTRLGVGAKLYTKNTGTVNGIVALSVAVYNRP